MRRRAVGVVCDGSGRLPEVSSKEQEKGSNNNKEKNDFVSLFERKNLSSSSHQLEKFVFCMRFENVSTWLKFRSPRE
jgi:hypothetical protein